MGWQLCATEWGLFLSQGQMLCEGNVSPQRLSLSEFWRGRAAHTASLVTQTRRLSAPWWLSLPPLLAFVSWTCPHCLVSMPLAFLFLTPLKFDGRFQMCSNEIALVNLIPNLFLACGPGGRFSLWLVSLFISAAN